jgi:hypothetical protein
MPILNTQKKKYTIQEQNKQSIKVSNSIQVKFNKVKSPTIKIQSSRFDRTRDINNLNKKSTKSKSKNKINTESKSKSTSLTKKITLNKNVSKKIQPVYFHGKK